MGERCLGTAPRRPDDVGARRPSHRPIGGDDELVEGGRRRRVELVERHRREHVLQARLRPAQRRGRGPGHRAPRPLGRQPREPPCIKCVLPMPASPVMRRPTAPSWRADSTASRSRAICRSRPIATPSAEASSTGIASRTAPTENSATGAQVMRHPPSTHATGESAAVVCRHGQARRGGDGGRVDPRHYAAPADVPIATGIDDVGVPVNRRPTPSSPSALFNHAA